MLLVLTQGTHGGEWRADIHAVEAQRMREISWMGVRMVRRQDATRPPPRRQVTWPSDTATADQAVNNNKNNESY